MLVEHNEMQVKLRLLPTEQLHPHEETNPKYLKELTDQISRDGIVKHPLIIEDKNHIILDGMHRYAALTNLACKLIPVALVDYTNPRITIERWSRLIDADERMHLLFEDLTPPLQIHNLTLREVGSESYAEGLMDDRLAFSKLTLKNQTYFVEGTPNNVVEAYQLLQELQEALQKEEFKVTMQTEAESRNLVEMDGKHCGLVGPRVKKEDVLQAVTSNRLFPPKVTRHILPMRVFNVDVPLERLRSADKDLETSNQEFIEMLKIREQNILPAGQTFEGRFYEEELIVFR